MNLPSTVVDLVVLAVATAQTHDIDPAVFARQIWAESEFNPQAVSRVGCVGLGQLHPAFFDAPDLDLYDPATNLDISAGYMRRLLDRYGDYARALAAYNWGPGNLDKLLKRLPENADWRERIPEETKRYLAKILPTPWKSTEDEGGRDDEEERSGAGRAEGDDRGPDERGAGEGGGDHEHGGR